MIRQKLSFKIALWIILVSLVLTAIGSSIMLKLEYDKSLVAFNQEVTDINARNKNTLQHILWIFDTAAMQSFLSDIVDGKKIHYAQLELNDGEIFFAGVKQADNVLHREFHIIHKEKGHEYHVGHFTVEGNLSFVRDAVFEKALNVWLTEIFKALFMTVFVTWLLRQLFVKHLEKVAHYTKNLNFSTLTTPLALDRKKQKDQDEISVVVDAFNDMRLNLLHEIEKSKAVEKELIAFKNAVENGYNVILITDLDKKIVYVNDIFEEVTGYSREEVIGKNPRLLKSNLLKKGYYDDFHQTLAKGEKWEGEFVNRRKDGTIFYERASVIPIKVDGEIVNYLAIKLDITQYKESVQKIKKLNIELENRVKERTSELEKTIVTLTETKERLIEAEKIAFAERDKAQEASRAKSVFLANISHELKTPLNGINGLAYLTQLKVKDEELNNNLRNIQHYSNNLLRLISDLLDASKSESHELKIIKAPFNLSEMLAMINKVYSERCDQKGLDFKFIIDTTLPPFVFGDAVRIYQVLTNLLNNALKFTSKGNVSLHVKVKALYDEKVDLCFEVIDEGIGISSKDLEHIFTPFYQTEISQRYYVEGSGLGLNICQSLVEQMGGSIVVTSEVGKGSSFSVNLSLTISSEAALVTPMPRLIDRHAVKKHILVVDDKKINQDIVCGLLDTLGIKCSRADTGYEAIEKIKTTVFDLVLMDIKMPAMDGHTCSRLIRKDLKLEIPIIALSANYSDEDIEKAKENGMDDYIAKPIEPEAFISKISTYLKLPTNINQNILKADGNPVLDIPDAINRFVNNETLYQQTLKMFRDEYVNTVEIVKSLVKSNDKEEFLSYLHSLKGLSANLSAKAFSEIIATIHDAIKHDEPYQHLLGQYETRFNTLIEAINMYLDEKGEVPTDNASVISKEEALATLKEYLEQQSTMALSYFATVKESFMATAEREMFESALNYYDFEKCLEVIQKLK